MYVDEREERALIPFSVQENMNASEEDRLPDSEVLAQMALVSMLVVTGY